MLPCRLRARGHASMTAGLQGIARQRVLMVHMPIKGQRGCWPVLHEPYTRVVTAVEPTLMAFGPPTLYYIEVQDIGTRAPTRKHKFWAVPGGLCTNLLHSD